MARINSVSNNLGHWRAPCSVGERYIVLRSSSGDRDKRIRDTGERMNVSLLWRDGHL